MNEVTTERFASFDGVELAIHRLGRGRPVVLLHGLFSDANTNWVRFGHARRLVDAGFEAIMPDLRAHGQSEAPHDPAATLAPHKPFPIGLFRIHGQTAAPLLFSLRAFLAANIGWVVAHAGNLPARMPGMRTPIAYSR